jgi:hypothetical protein
MPDTLSAALAALFADPNIGRDAVYIADGGAPVLVRIVARRADAVTDFGDARLWSETTRIDLRVAEVPTPRPGDRIEIDGGASSSRTSPSATASGSYGSWIPARPDRDEADAAHDAGPRRRVLRRGEGRREG